MGFAESYAREGLGKTIAIGVTESLEEVRAHDTSRDSS